MQLLDQNGSKVPPTALGATLGSRFSELTGYSSEIAEKIPANGSNSEHPHVRNLRPDAYAGEKFPPPEQLFKIVDSGRYSLRLEFQVFEVKRKGTNYTHNLIHIPPIEVPVIKQ